MRCIDGSCYLFDIFYQPSFYGTLLQSVLVLMALRQLYFHCHRVASHWSRILFHLILLLAMIFDFLDQLQAVLTHYEFFRFHYLWKYTWALHVLANLMCLGAIVWTIVAWSNIFWKVVGLDIKCSGAHVFIILYGLQVAITLYMMKAVVISVETRESIDINRSESLFSNICNTLAYKMYAFGTVALHLLCCLGLGFWGRRLQLQLNWSGIEMEIVQQSLHRVNIVLVSICTVVMLRVCGLGYDIYGHMIFDKQQHTQHLRTKTWVYLSCVYFIPNIGILLSLLWLHRRKLNRRQSKIPQTVRLDYPSSFAHEQNLAELTTKPNVYYIEYFI